MIPLVLVHGSGHTHESFAEQVAEFENADAVSLPGHPEGQALSSIGDCAVWLAKYLQWKGTLKAIVGGNSLGGAVALEFALRYPERTAGLVLLGTGGRLKVSPEIFAMLDDNWPDCIDTISDWSLPSGAPAELRLRLREWHLAVGQATTRQDFTNCNGFDAMDRVASIDAKTLIVVGSEDQMTPPKYSRFLHEKIAGSRLAIVEGAGHLAHAEKPQAVNELIGTTFNEVPA
jgi:pimeloyl-ACP methyl ester carboxylesterase